MIQAPRRIQAVGILLSKAPGRGHRIVPCAIQNISLYKAGRLW